MKNRFNNLLGVIFILSGVITLSYAQEAVKVENVDGDKADVVVTSTRTQKRSLAEVKQMLSFAVSQMAESQKAFQAQINYYNTLVHEMEKAGVRE